MAQRIRSILIVDDEEDVLDLLQLVFETSGFDVRRAQNGKTAVANAYESPPDVILLDVMMPGLDGWRVAEQLLDDNRTTGIPIIFLTARAEFRDRAHGLDIGGVDYVTKPFNPLELAPLVRDVLHRLAQGEREALRAENLDKLRALMEG
jgi:DNA-binding response OmpR family regulator